MSEFADLLGYEDHQGDVMSDIAQMKYEEGLIQECRDWINGELNTPLNTDHVRVLLAWIDSKNLTPLNNKKEF
jgi:hypothetical protein